MGRPRKNLAAAPTSEPQSSEPTISKAQAVRNALGEGLEDLADIEGFLKSRHGIEMSRQMISAYKANEKKRLEKGGRSPRAVGADSPAGGDDVLEAMEALKPLIAKLGVDKVKRLAELLG